MMILMLILLIILFTLYGTGTVCDQIPETLKVVKDTLESRGVLGQIKARIRAEVFNALDDQSEAKPNLSSENLIINELIREYLEFNKYKYSASVLQAESGQPQQHLDRDFLAQELNILEDKSAPPVPLLYGIVAHFLSHNKREEQETSRSQRSHKGHSGGHG